MKSNEIKIVRPLTRLSWELIILTAILCLIIGVAVGYWRAYRSIWTWGIDKEMAEIRLTIKEIPIQNMRLEKLMQEVESWKTEMVKIGIFTKGRKEMVIHLPVDDLEALK